MPLPLQPPAAPQREHPLLSYAHPVGILTGDNPLYPASAQGGNEGLKRELQQLKASFEEVWGKYGGVPERALMVHNLPREQLYALGQKYGQESVIHSEHGQRQFLYTNGPKTGQMHVGTTHEHWPTGTAAPDDFYTTLPGVGHVRLGFDFANTHSAVPANGPIQQPAQAPQVQPGPVMTKREIAHALHKTLTDVLTKAAGLSHQPLADVSRIAEEYQRHAGLLPSPQEPHTVDEATIHRAAGAYEALRHDPQNPEVRQAYDALKRETLAQYQFLKGKGYTFTPSPHAALTPGSFGVGETGPTFVSVHKDQPYRDTHELLSDLKDNKHLHVYSDPGGMPEDHPLAAPLPFQDPLQNYNTVFRAVHDVFGHGRTGADFGHSGEDHTWRSHSSMFSPLARRALTTETRGQNAAFHFGKNGASNRADPVHAIYPEQKAALMPPEFHEHTSSPNLTGVSVQKSEGSTAVAEETKRSVPEALHELHKLTKARVEAFEQDCVALRKAELAKKSPPGRKEEVEKLKAKGLPASEAFGIAWKQHNKLDKTVGDASSQKAHAGNPVLDKAAVTDGGMGSPSTAPAPNLGEMSMAEDAKLEAYAKGEMRKDMGTGGAPSVGAPPPGAARFGNAGAPSIGSGTSGPSGGGAQPNAPRFGASEDAKLEAYAKGEYRPMAKAELCKACGLVKGADHDCDKAEAYAKGEIQPAGSAPDGPQPKKGVLPDDKKPKLVEEAGSREGGSDGTNVKKLKKAGLPPAAGAPKAPSAGAGAPKIGGGLPKAPKLPGPAKPVALAKPAAPAGGVKPPAMGAGQPALKRELTKAALPGVRGPAPNKEVGGLLNELRPQKPVAAPPPTPVHAQFDVTDQKPLKPGPTAHASPVALGPQDQVAAPAVRLPGVTPGAAKQGIASTRPAEQLPQQRGAPLAGKTIAVQSLVAPPAAGRAAPPALQGAPVSAPSAMQPKKPGIFGRIAAGMMGKAEDKPAACPKCGEDHKGADHATATLFGADPKVLHPNDKKAKK